MPTSWPCCCAGRSTKSSARTASSVYFRLSTRPIDQPERTLDPALDRGDRRRRVLAARAGDPAPSSRSPIAARSRRRRMAAHEAILEDVPGAGLLAITSPGSAAPRLAGSRWRTGKPGIAERLLARLRPGAALVTVTDGHPATLSWLGAVARQRRRAARRRPVRPVRRHPGPLPRIRARRGRDHRRRGARLSAGRPSDLNAVIAPLGRIDPASLYCGPARIEAGCPGNFSFCPVSVSLSPSTLRIETSWSVKLPI